VAYYSNFVATRQILLLSGDIELNPGPIIQGVDSRKDYLEQFVNSLDNSSSNLRIAHINVRSLRNKLDEIKILLKVCCLDVLSITESHLDEKIANQQLNIENYKLARRDRETGPGGGCIVYVADHICFNRLKSLETRNIEGLWIKITVNATSIVLGTVYRPPSDSNFFNKFYTMLELVWSKFKNVLIVGDLNADISRSVNNDVSSIPGKKLLRTLEHFNYSIMNDQPTRVTTSSSTLIDHVISSKPETIKETKTLELGISDHMLVYVSLKTKLRRPPPKIINARSYSKFDLNEFRKDVEKAPWSVCSVFDDMEEVYWAWGHLFNNICNKHAPYRQVKIRQNSLPWITPQIRHLMNLRYKTFLKAKKLQSQELFAEYRKLRNSITHEVRVSKTMYYTDLFNEVKSCKTYWY
jgi:hypothetical protein